MNAPVKTPRLAARAASIGFAEDFVPETEAASIARRAAAELELPAVSQGAAAALSFLASAVRARAVVEVGTGAGVSGVALFAGMVQDGILTSIDTEAEHQTEARKAFIAMGVRPQRFRLIAGAALNVLPKLTDGVYDLVFIDGDILEYVEYVAQAERLLRRGGVLVVNNALWHDAIADQNNEDDEAVIIREALAAVTETEGLRPLLIPLGEGLLAAVKA